MNKENAVCKYNRILFNLIKDILPYAQHARTLRTSMLNEMK